MAPERFLFMDQRRQTQREALRRMSPAQKLSVMTSLIGQAYRLKEAWIRATETDLSEEELHRRLLQAMAGDGS